MSILQAEHGPRASFVDSQGWMAVAHQRDQDHQRAAEVFANIVKQGWQLYSTTWTYYDALSHMKERAKGGGLQGARLLRQLVEDDDRITVVPIDPDLEEAAVAYFWAHDDKAWSITTCANLIVMTNLELWYVLSANHHYGQAGFVNLY